MISTFVKNNKKLNAGKLIVIILALFCYLVIAVTGGADIVSMLSFFVCAIIYLYIPGLAFTEWIGPKEQQLQTPLIILYGAGFLAFVHCLAVRLNIVLLLKILPLAVTVIYVFLRAKNKRKPQIEIWDNGVVLWALLCLFFALTMSAENAHPIAAGVIELENDLLWNIGNSNALSKAFPAQDIRFSMVRFSYHYFTELVTAAMHLVSGASNYDITVFFAGPLFIAAELAALVSLGKCYFTENKEKFSHAFVYILFICQCFSMFAVIKNGDGIFANTLLKHIVTNINSQATALIFICVFLSIFCTVSRAKFNVGFMHIIALFASFFVLSFSKGPQAAILLCAFAITMIFVIVFHKPDYIKAVISLIGIVMIFVGVYFFLYSSGTNNSMIFSIFAMENSITYQVLSPYADWLCKVLPISGYVWLVGIGIINSFCMLPFQFTLWIAGLPSTIKNIFRLDPTRMLLNGAVVGGFTAYHIFYHSSSSQAYFALLAMILITLLATEQLPKLKSKIYFSWPLWLTGAAAVITGVCMIGVFSAQGIQQFTQTIGIAEKVYSDAYVSAEDELAMEYLAQNAPQETVFATNRTSTTPWDNGGISNCYSAMSGIQAYMEGWTYAVTNMGVDQAVVTHKQDTNALFFSEDTDMETIINTAEQEGINCLVYSKRWPGSVNPQLVPDYENSSVSIYFIDKQ